MIAIENIRDAYLFKTERESKLFDKFERIRFYSAPNKDLIFQPFVSEYMVEKGFNPIYPDDKKFAIAFSHDIDLLTQYKLFSFHNRIKSLYKKLKFRLPKIENKLYKRVLIDENNPERFLALNNKYNIQSTFYFLALDAVQQDYNYDVSFVVDLINKINQEGSEVGLHGGHEAYNNSKQIGIEKQRLQQYLLNTIPGYRNHYLRFKIPYTWQSLKENGFTYDSTYGHCDVVGFRNGLSHPFFPYDHTAKDYIDILEIPLIIMDTTLFEYMRLGLDEAMQLCKQLIDCVQRTKGAVSILWHNHYLQPQYIKFYEQLIEYCSRLNAWMPTSGGLNDWWRSQNYHQQQKDIMASIL